MLADRHVPYVPLFSISPSCLIGLIADCSTEVFIDGHTPSCQTCNGKGRRKQRRNQNLRSSCPHCVLHVALPTFVDATPTFWPSRFAASITRSDFSIPPFTTFFDALPLYDGKVVE
jgi:hypothetical protein